MARVAWGIKWDLIPAPLGPTQGFSSTVMKNFLFRTSQKGGKWDLGSCGRTLGQMSRVGQQESIVPPLPAFQRLEGPLVMSHCWLFLRDVWAGFPPLWLISCSSPSDLEDPNPTLLNPARCWRNRLVQLQTGARTPNPALSSFAWRLHDPLLNMHMNWDATNFPGVS